MEGNNIKENYHKISELWGQRGALKYIQRENN